MVKRKAYLEMNVLYTQTQSILVKNMMYGFGEEKDPNEETLELMELYVIEFVSNVAKRSL